MNSVQDWLENAEINDPGYSVRINRTFKSGMDDDDGEINRGVWKMERGEMGRNTPWPFTGEL